MAERGEEEEVTVADLTRGFCTEGIGAELLVDLAVAFGQFEEMRVGVVHEGPPVFLLAGIEHEQGEEGRRDQTVSEGVAHERYCGEEGLRRKLERSIRHAAG